MMLVMRVAGRGLLSGDGVDGCAVLGIPLYISPLGFNWDPHNSSWVLPGVTPQNVDVMANVAVLDIMAFAAASASNNLLITVGGDFAFQDAPLTVRTRCLHSDVMWPGG